MTIVLFPCNRAGGASGKYYGWMTEVVTRCASVETVDGQADFVGIRAVSHHFLSNTGTCGNAARAGTRNATCPDDPLLVGPPGRSLSRFQRGSVTDINSYSRYFALRRHLGECSFALPSRPLTAVSPELPWRRHTQLIRPAWLIQDSQQNSTARFPIGSLSCRLASAMPVRLHRQIVH